MHTCLFLTFRAEATTLAASEMARLEAMLRAAPKLRKALLHMPDAASDPYVKDHAPPLLVLQLYYDRLAELEATLSRSGPLRALTSREDFPVLARADVAQQAMMVRAFDVPEPAFENAHGTPHCTYLVSYEGEAKDLNAWLDHYLDRHTRHMARFPGIRELEVYTRLDWVSSLPWPRVNFMQRNKVVFDSPGALTQALHSSVRHEMRADFHSFPAFTGPNRHHAMATRIVDLSSR
jgi:hypothetical protein